MECRALDGSSRFSERLCRIGLWACRCCWFLQVAEAAGWSAPLLSSSLPLEKESDLLVHEEPSEVRSPLDWLNDAEHEHLIEAPTASTTQIADVREYPISTAHNTQPSRREPGIRVETVLTAGILALLAAPSIIAPEAFHAFPLPVIAPGGFTLGVACIMPVLSPSTSPKNHLRGVPRRERKICQQSRDTSLARERRPL